MGHQEYTVHTWTCSIPDCKEQLTGHGKDYNFEKSWEHDVFFSREMDLCPFHVKELKEFLFNE